jgi:hypothetical protein
MRVDEEDDEAVSDVILKITICSNWVRYWVSMVKSWLWVCSFRETKGNWE